MNHWSPQLILRIQSEKSLPYLRRILLEKRRWRALFSQMGLLHEQVLSRKSPRRLFVLKTEPDPSYGFLDLHSRTTSLSLMDPSKIRGNFPSKGGSLEKWMLKRG